MPPPGQLEIDFFDGTQGCPKEFVACFDMEQTKKLIREIEGLRRYSGEAWERCRPKE